MFLWVYFYMYLGVSAEMKRSMDPLELKLKFWAVFLLIVSWGGPKFWPDRLIGKSQEYFDSYQWVIPLDLWLIMFIVGTFIIILVRITFSFETELGVMKFRCTEVT